MIALALAPLSLAVGVPAFEQDWQWPIHNTQCASYIWLGAQPWNSSGIGSAQIYPEAWAPYAISGSLCSIAGPHTGLVLYLALLFVVAAIGIRWLARTLGFGELPSISAVAFYLGNPLILNELHAGHLHFIFSYALLPNLLAAIRDKAAGKRPIHIGVLLGLTAAQQQFFLFALILAILLGLPRGPSWFARIALPAFLVSLCFIASQWVLAIADPASAVNLAAYRPLVHWEESQSVPLSEALRFLGYIGGYDAALPSWVRAATWIFPLIALAGAFIAIARSTGRTWVVAAICAVLLVAGLRGPFASLVAFATQHIAAFAIFRELYAFEAVAALSYAMLFALLVTALQSPMRRRPVAAAIATVIVVPCIVISAYMTRGMTTFTPSAAGAAAIRHAASEPGSGRYLPIPSALPQSVIGAKTTGISPFTLSIGNHPSAVDTLNEPPYGGIAARTNHAIVKLDALAISAILIVPGVAQTNNYEPQLQSIFPAVHGGIQKDWSFEPRTARRLALLLPTSSVEIGDGGMTIDLNALAQDVNPRNGWARTALWNNLPLWLYERPAGIFTLRNSVSADLLPGTSILAGTAAGSLHATSCSREQQLDKHYAVFVCNGQTTLRGVPPITISEAVRGRIRFAHPVAGGSVTIVRDNRWLIDADVAAPPGAVLELRERRDLGWQCVQCNGTPARGDNYANAWVLPEGLDRRVSIVFAPARVYYLALILSFAAFLVAFIDVAALLWRSQKVSRRCAAAEKSDRPMN